jgi:hypothetical protein
MNVGKVWGARYTLGPRYLSKNTVIVKSVHIICKKNRFNGRMRISVPAGIIFVNIEQKYSYMCVCGKIGAFCDPEG